MNLPQITQDQLLDALLNVKMQDLQSYHARDGSLQYFRKYPASSNLVMILIHGVAEDSKYLYQLADSISSSNLATVYTPDLRGYGAHPQRRGDIDYIGQIEDDLSDFIQWIKGKHPDSKIILAGHSFGGGTVLRYAGSKYATEIDSYLLLAPFVHPNAPTSKVSKSKGSTKVSISKIVLLTILQKFHVKTFHHLKVLNFKRPVNKRHGSETLSLSFRMVISRLPVNYKENIKAINKPTLLIVGENDKLFNNDQFDDLFSQNHFVKTNVIPNHNHDGILFSEDVFSEISNWIKTLPANNYKTKEMATY